MGDSGGRSRRNPTGEGAIRRATQRERTYVDASEDPVPLYSRGTERAMAAVAWAALSGILVIFILMTLGILQ